MAVAEMVDPVRLLLNATTVATGFFLAAGTVCCSRFIDLRLVPVRILMIRTHVPAAIYIRTHDRPSTNHTRRRVENFCSRMFVHGFLRRRKSSVRQPFVDCRAVRMLGFVHDVSRAARRGILPSGCVRSQTFSRPLECNSKSAECCSLSF